MCYSQRTLPHFSFSCIMLLLTIFWFVDRSMYDIPVLTATSHLLFVYQFVISFLCWIIQATCSRRYNTTPEICLTLKLQWLPTAFFLHPLISPRSHYLQFHVQIFSSSTRPCLLWYLLGLRPPKSAVGRQWNHSYDYVLRPLTAVWL
jgi:hypothetical protein